MADNPWQLFAVLAALFFLYSFGDLVWLWCARRVVRPPRPKSGKADGDEQMDERLRDADAALLRVWGRVKFISALALLTVSALVIVYFVLLSVL